MSWSNLTDGVMRAATQAFGEVVVYTPSGGSAFEIDGIFRSQFSTIDVDSGFEVLTETPNLGIRNNDFTTPPAQGDTLVVNGTTYTVQTVHKDGDSGSILLLHEGVVS